MTWIRLLRLCLSVALEGLASFFHILFFPLYRRRIRRSIREMMVRGTRRGAIGGVTVLALTGLFSSGCNTFPGSSFEKQVEELRWSTVQIFDPEFEKSWDSLTSDLETLTDPELDQLPETIEMFGW